MTRCIFLIFLSFIGLTNYTLSQSTQISLKLSDLLKDGEHQVSIMDSIKETARQKELLKKFFAAADRNMKWFTNYMNASPEGQMPPYNKKLGVSKSEYQEIKNFNDNPELICTDTEDLTIYKKQNIITFKGTGRLKIFDSLQIDIIKNTAQFKNYELKYLDTIYVSKKKTGLKNSYLGAFYYFEQHDENGILGIKQFQFFNKKTFRLIIAHIANSDNTFMKLAGYINQNGEKIYNLNLPLVFN